MCRLRALWVRRPLASSVRCTCTVSDTARPLAGTPCAAGCPCARCKAPTARQSRPPCAHACPPNRRAAPSSRRRRRGAACRQRPPPPREAADQACGAQRAAGPPAGLFAEHGGCQRGAGAAASSGSSTRRHGNGARQVRGGVRCCGCVESFREVGLGRGLRSRSSRACLHLHSLQQAQRRRQQTRPHRLLCQADVVAAFQPCGPPLALPLWPPPPLALLTLPHAPTLRPATPCSDDEAGGEGGPVVQLDLACGLFDLKDAAAVAAAEAALVNGGVAVEAYEGGSSSGSDSDGSGEEDGEGQGGGAAGTAAAAAAAAACDEGGGDAMDEDAAEGGAAAQGPAAAAAAAAGGQAAGRRIKGGKCSKRHAGIQELS